MNFICYVSSRCESFHCSTTGTTNQRRVSWHKLSRTEHTPDGGKVVFSACSPGMGGAGRGGVVPQVQGRSTSLPSFSEDRVPFLPSPKPGQVYVPFLSPSPGMARDRGTLPPLTLSPARTEYPPFPHLPSQDRSTLPPLPSS